MTPATSTRLVRITAAATALAAVASLGAGIATPPRSGPNCTTGCIGHPYTGGAAFVPRDYWWMYPASLTALLAVLLLAVLVRRSTAAADLAARAAVITASIAAGVLLTCYGIQLAVVAPSLRAGEADGIGLLSQYNPHGVFIAMENVGYLLLGLALGAAGAGMVAGSRAARTARAAFVVCGLATPSLLVLLALAYGARLDYRFEVYSIALCWLALIVGGLALAVAPRQAPGTVHPAPESAPPV